MGATPVHTGDIDDLFERARDLLSETFLAEYDGLLAFLARRGVQRADAEDIVGATYRSLLGGLADAGAELDELRLRREPDESRVRELVGKLTERPGRGLLYTAVRNRHLSDCRATAATPVADPGAGAGAAPTGYTPVPDGPPRSIAEPGGDRFARDPYATFDIDPAVVVLTEHSSARRHAALRRLVRVLLERGGLSAGTVELIDRIYAFTGTEAPPERAAPTGSRARGARKRNGHTHDPNRGRITRVAGDLGTSVTTVSRGNAALLAVLRRGIYVAGVLAATGTMRSAPGIHAALDGYDRFRSAAERPALELLELAATTLGTGESTGTRADRVRFARLAAERQPPDTAGWIDSLHTAEAGLAAELGNPHPNCVTVCAPHNPDPTRGWEH
ncbi:hypothetical protein [Nocardia jiangsuensis]|uniref:DUF222 domain-containing protein n=1 Tax=Nocardia jiangsuensis TaxID=1691563 RepID=A0ABV8DRF4_9NOCA